MMRIVFFGKELQEKQSSVIFTILSVTQHHPPTTKQIFKHRNLIRFFMLDSFTMKIICILITILDLLLLRLLIPRDFFLGEDFFQFFM